MPKKWKPSCPWIKKEQAQAKRALSAWHKIAAAGEPCFAKPMGANHSLTRNVYLYAAALGQKRGQLPENLGAWSCWGWFPVVGGKPMEWALIKFAKAGMAEPIVVKIENLLAWPAPAVEEEAPEMAMAA